MSDELLVRGLYAPMVAVLVIPEPATFVIFMCFLIGFATLLGSVGLTVWSQLNELRKVPVMHRRTVSEPQPRMLE